MISLSEAAASDGSGPRAVWKVWLLELHPADSLGRERRRKRALVDVLPDDESCSSDCYCRETAL